MSDSSTPSTIDLTDFTVWDATNVLEYATSHFAAIWIACDQSHVPPMPAYKASFVQHLQWEADPMGAMLLPCPVVTGQVEGDPLLNQILAVRVHIQHLSDALASMLEEKIQMATMAALTMSQLEGPMGELEEALSNSC
ncbi:hypothetical protein BDR04DRAFT_1158933 [Suillus decipiens]|nr:hypothetical protein BDR04DRAFT_1158933 [Suillus decipiens]